ncbi:MAG: FkbM family methyltransferase [Opitutales bacterium]|nr:FkbM family methyltransferase [Opitutales bacterium]
MAISNRIKRFIKSALQSKGYRLDRIPTLFRDHPVEADLSYVAPELIIEREMAIQGNAATVVQIGAFDGVSNDFLYDSIKKVGSPALLVEPQPEPFQSLVKNYEGQAHVSFERVAIADYDGVLPMYRIKEAYHPFIRLAPQFTSPNRQHIVNALSGSIPGIPSDTDACIEEFDVPCLTLQSLFERHQIHKISVLQVDTEGYDYRIIKMLDFTKYRPTIINFEVVHMTRLQIDEIMWMLYRNGYKIMRYGINMIAKCDCDQAVHLRHWSDVAGSGL